MSRNGKNFICEMYLEGCCATPLNRKPIFCKGQQMQRLGNDSSRDLNLIPKSLLGNLINRRSEAA